MSLVDTVTGEIVDPPMDPAEARMRVNRVKANIGQSREDIIALWSGRAWLGLGFASWDALCDTEFEVRLALPRGERVELVTSLRAEGMSTRAIGDAIGVSKSQVAADLQVSSSGHVRDPDSGVTVTTVTEVKGTDGKRYTLPTMAQVRTERTAPRAPRTDVVVVINTVLLKARDASHAAQQIKREHLVQRTNEAATWSRDLAESLEPLQRLLDTLREVSQ